MFAPQFAQNLARARGAGGFEREVAIKKLHPHLLNDAPDAALDLIEEAKLASRIRHPNVVPVLDSGTHEGSPWLTQALVPGGSLPGPSGEVVTR